MEREEVMVRRGEGEEEWGKKRVRLKKKERSPGRGTEREKE